MESVLAVADLVQAAALLLIFEQLMEIKNIMRENRKKEGA